MQSFSSGFERDFAPLRARLCAGLAEYLADSGARGFVVGVSGGLDSAVVATLCAAVAPTYALVMPAAASNPANMRDALGLLAGLGLAFEVVEIAPIIAAFEATSGAAQCFWQTRGANSNLAGLGADNASGADKMSGENCATAGEICAAVAEKCAAVAENCATAGEICAAAAGNLAGNLAPKPAPQSTPQSIGNLAARVRMSLLYDCAFKRGLLVAGTSNKSERLLGYGTIFGDLACAVNPLGALYKSEIFGFARALGVPRGIIAKPPSADLWDGQSDEGELGYSYFELDIALKWLECRGEIVGGAVVENFGSAGGAGGRNTSVGADFRGVKMSEKEREIILNSNLIEFVKTRVKNSEFKRRMPRILEV